MKSEHDTELCMFYEER